MDNYLLQDEFDIESVTLSDLESLFSDSSVLTKSLNQVCSVQDAEEANKARERFIGLANKYFASLPVPSSSADVGLGSIDQVVGKDVLVDAIWAVDQACELQSEAGSPGHARTNLGQLVKAIEANKLLSPDFLKVRLDTALLALSGILAPTTVQAWGKSEPRIKTAMLYKQQKFNLSREETEGYSKLEVELISSMGPPHDSKTARPVEALAIIRARAEATVTNIKALIGFFDLDPTRALDIILDVFQDNILHHHVFFRELLKASPWGDQAVPEASKQAGATSEARVLLPDGSFKSKPRSSSSVCAQILGFKFAWYSSGEGAGEAPAEKLYLLAALLIWDGLVDLPSLWPHLHPTNEEDMNALKQKFSDDISDRIAKARSNALALAGVLADDGPPSLSQARPPSGSTVTISGIAAANGRAPSPATTPVANEPVNAKVGLLRSMLAIGALEPAFYILSTYQWISDPYPEVAELLSRICNVAISDYYSAHASPFSAKCTEVHEKVANLQQSRPRYSVEEKKIVAPPVKFHNITARPLDVPRTIAGAWRQPVYFFAEWKDRLPVCRNGEEVLDVVSQLIKLIGVHSSKHQEFFVRLLRIVKLETVDSQADRKAWEGIIRFHLIPALALAEPNPATSMELWEVLRNFPYATRFSFYGEWKDRLYKRLPELRVRRAEAERDAKGLLKRLSVDNVKQFGRSLAKVAHCNPCVLFDIALNQVQSYDNLVGPIVESVRYLTPFGYDALAYSLLDALSNPEKERTKTDGTNISLWLQSLATFAGTLCRRWNIEVSILLQYILNQLRDGNAKDLVVLRELVSKMSGIEPVADLSDAQVTALGGGRTLQSEALNPTTAVEKRSATKRSTLRLKSALQESHLVVPLLIAVATQRQNCIHGDDNAPLKYLGNLFDSCQQVLFQYLEFLLSQYPPEQFADIMPPLSEVWGSYGLEPSIAFQIVRPGLQRAIQKSDALSKAETEARLKTELKASREARLGASTSKSESEAQAKSKPEDKLATDETVVKIEEQDIKMQDIDVADTAEASGTKEAPWHPALLDANRVAEARLPEDVKPYLTAGFFVTFWQLSLYDIFVPSKRYLAESDRLKGIVREIDQSLKALPAFPGQVMDRSSDTEKKRARERCTTVADALTSDMKIHAEIYDATKKRLQSEKMHWFLCDLPELSLKESSAARKLLVQYIMQECLLPRSRLSPIDAAYCARLIRTMHNLGAGNFASLHVYDKIFSDDLAAIVFHCTESEARNYGRFLYDCLSDLSAWYESEAIYNKQAIGAGLPGFQRVWGLRKPGDPIPEKDLLKYKEFVTISGKWQKKMGEAFGACIQSRDYMCIRNAILILTKIAKYFPANQKEGGALEGTISELIDTEKREDLKVLAMGYSALLKKQSASWDRAAPVPALPATSASVSIQTSNSSPAPPPAAKLAQAPAASSPAPSTTTPNNKPAPASTANLPTAPRGQAATTTNSTASAPSGSPRPAGLPARPLSELEQRRQERLSSQAGSNQSRSNDARRVAELSSSAHNDRPTQHALPQRPAPEGSRPSISRNPSASHAVTSLKSQAQAPSQPASPLRAPRSDAMDVDEPATQGRGASARPPQNTREQQRQAGKEEFARPADPEPRSRAASPGKDVQASTTNGKDGTTTQRSPKDGRRGRREETDAVRGSRAGSEESSHSSNRDKKDRDRDRSDRRRERDRDRRSDRESDREKSDRHRGPRDKERDASSRRHKDGERDGDRRKDREADRESTGRSDRRSDKERKDRDREKDKPRDREDRERERDRNDKDKERERSERPRESDRGERKIAGTSARRDERRVDDTRDDKRNSKEDPSNTSGSTSQRDLKRGPETEAQGSSKATAAPAGEPSAKRVRTDEPALPSGPKADRIQQEMPDILPARPAPLVGSKTTIKGRAAATQGIRIKSAASISNVLSSAQEHNARIDRQVRSATPATPAETPTPKESPKAPTESAAAPEAKPKDEKPSDLFGRLGPRNSNVDAESNRRTSSSSQNQRRGGSRR